MQKESTATIVNLSSNQAIKPFAELSAYACSKAGIATLTKVLAAEFAPTIRANVVCPGSIATPMNAANRRDIEAYVANDPMKRIGAASEVAQAILFLTCSESSFITGSTLAVDGGRTLY
jgi:NAD(P)-dependent dehydrogenase (short-subunit alcohol dehydrogenase family)